MSIFKLSDSDADKTTEAEAAADLARAFPMMVCGDVQAMRLALNEARNLYDIQRTNFIQSRLLSVAIRLKNQGAVFGYPLVTDVAAHLYNFISQHKSYDKTELNVINNDLLLLQNILWKRISGDGGKKGQEILAQLI